VKIAVTGARGYLGRPLVEALAADERVSDVVAIDARQANGNVPAGVRAVRRDVRDPELARDLEGADALIHLAFRVLGRGEDAESVNVGGSRNAFDAAVRAGLTTIVHASSAAAYGCAADNPVPLTEDCPLRAVPAFYYPETKVAVERALDELEATHPDLRVVRMRPVATLGPGAPVIAGGRGFVTLSDFDPLMQFTWIDDVVAAFSAALHATEVAGPFNIGAPGAVPASRVARLIGARPVRLPHRAVRAVSRAGARLRLPGALHPGWVDMARYPIVVDSGRAERELGWRASCDCTEALERFGRIRPGSRRKRNKEE
jgi:UDP-glucose 4-epimerase